MNNRIFFLSPDNKNATGGVKQLYRQVDILNRNGYNAFILHKNIGHKSKFFMHETSIKYNSKIFNDIKYLLRLKKNTSKKKAIKLTFKKYLYDLISFCKSPFEIKIKDSDILVFPEIYGTAINNVERKNIKIIFNQNCYYSFDHFSICDSVNSNPYLFNNTFATIVASEDAFSYMKFSFKDLNLFKLRLGIDENIFKFSEKKSKKIAFMPRKLEEDVVQVINILKARNHLSDWEFVPIENKSEVEVGEILKESTFFLSFNHREGFGLPPAEAMACGCIVIGYVGLGGLEYFSQEFSYKVPDRNIISFVKQIESAVSEYNENSKNIIEKGKKASEFVLKNYNLKNEENDILMIWEQFKKQNLFV